MKTKVHPFEQVGPDMMVGCDHEGNRVAIEVFNTESDFVVDEEISADLEHYRKSQDFKDAKRYRWLRANAKEIVFGGLFAYMAAYDKGKELDEAVDASMAKLVEGPQMTATEVMQRTKDA